MSRCKIKHLLLCARPAVTFSLSSEDRRRSEHVEVLQAGVSNRFKMNPFRNGGEGGNETKRKIIKQREK